MSSIVDSVVSIQTSSQSVPSPPSWLGEVTLIAHSLRRQEVFSALEEHVRFARPRFGHFEVIDFVAVLLGYAISGERTIEAFSERLQPFANAFMAVFGRERLPHRSTLSRSLSSLDQAPLEALRALFLKDLLARPLVKEGPPGGLWGREGSWWLVARCRRHAASRPSKSLAPDVRSTASTASTRARSVLRDSLPRKRGEITRTRTSVLQAHTHQWLATFGGAGHGDYRGELRRALDVIKAYLSAPHVPLAQALVRLDGQDGNGAVVEDLAGLSFVMRGKDSQLLAPRRGPGQTGAPSRPPPDPS